MRKDPVDRESSRVQAVACFFPPADLLNYGQPGKEMIHATDHGMPFRPAFDYHELDKKTNVWVPITDTERLREITRQISPITHVSPDDPPTLIIHGDADHSGAASAIRDVREEAPERGCSGQAGGQEEGRPRLAGDRQRRSLLVDWFDEYLKKSGADKKDQ